MKVRPNVQLIDQETTINQFGVIKTYKKTALTEAIQMKEPFDVVTREGLMFGKAGDYLCIGIRGEHWPVDKEIFEETYEEVKVPA